MKYTHLTEIERYMISALRKQGISTAKIAKQLGRHKERLTPTRGSTPNITSSAFLSRSRNASRIFIAGYSPSFIFMGLLR
ncbi:hypothetical protein CK207_16800 [Vibrio anguillarum]|nr:hypothetical protein CK207_16800 [Vibrio anguillarum]